MSVPILALSFSYPQLFSSWMLAGNDDSKSLLDVNLEKITGRSRSAWGAWVNEIFSLPEEVARVVRLCDPAVIKKRTIEKRSADQSPGLAAAVFYGMRIARELCRLAGASSLEAVLKECQQRLVVTRAQLRQVLDSVLEQHIERCRRLGYQPLRLPDYMCSSDRAKQHVDEMAQPTAIGERMSFFLYELKACFRMSGGAGETARMPQAIYCTLQALLKGLGFRRACLLRFDSNRGYSMPLLLTGLPHESFSLLLRSGDSTGSQYMPDLKACAERRAIFEGDPIFKNDWPFVAFPIVWRGGVQGVFYADFAGLEREHPLETHEQVACIALAEGWQSVPADFS